MPIIPSPISTAKKFKSADLVAAGFPTANPGGNKPWLKGEVLVAKLANSIPFAAADYGVSTSATGLANSIALQAAEDAVFALGGGLIDLPDGTLNFAANGVNPYHAARDKCVVARSNVFLRGRGFSTILRFADNVQTNARLTDLIVAGGNTTNYGISNVKMVGNTAGNSTLYTGGYVQGSNAGTLLHPGINLSLGIGGETSKLYMDNVWFYDNWGSPMDAIRVTGGRLKNIIVEDCGEGIQFNVYGDLIVRDYRYLNPSLVSVGDGIELVSGTNLLLDGFNISGAAGGSAVDITGRNVVVCNGVITGGSGGLIVQADAASASEPNSDKVLVSNVIASDISQVGSDAFIIGANALGGPARITFSNCHAMGCYRGFIVSRQSAATRAVGQFKFLNCTSTGHYAAGLTVYGATKVSVRGCDFSDSVTGENGNGIILNSAPDAAANYTYVEIEDTTCNRNDRFGVYVEEYATHLPQGYVRASCQGNTADDEYYSPAAVGVQMYCGGYPTATGLEITNTASREMNLSLGNVHVTGDQRLFWNYAKVSNLQGGRHNQILKIFFNQETRVEDVSQGGTRNIATQDGTLEYFTTHDSITLRYSATTQLWYEVDRRQSVFTPFTPASMTLFRAWWKRDAQLFSDAGGTVPVVLGTDRAMVWKKHLGTAADFTADATGAPLTDAAGGVKGNAVDRFMRIASIDLSGPYTIVLALKTGAAPNNKNYFGAAAGAANWTFAASNGNAIEFYENADAANTPVYNPAATEVCIVISVAANGDTVLWKPDGTSVSGNGSSGGTSRSATTALEILAGYGAGATPADSTMIVRDVAISDETVTANEVAQLQGYFA